MRRLLWGVLLFFLPGCGSGGNSVQVTPVMANTRGTYRLVASRTSVTPTGGVSSFFAYSSGTLRLDDTGYTLTLTGPGQQESGGNYQIGTSVNTIPNSRHGIFSFTANDTPIPLTGSYDVTPDYTLVFTFDPVTLTDQGLITRSETWLKISDSPRR